MERPSKHVSRQKVDTLNTNLASSSRPLLVGHSWFVSVNDWALVSPDGVAPSQMVGVSASVNLPLHHEVQKFSSGTGSPGWSRKRAV